MIRQATTKRTVRLSRRFSLRMLLLITSVLAIWMGWLIPRAEQQKRGVEWILAQGGQVLYRYQTDDDCEPQNARNAPGPKFLVDLIGLDYFSSVDVVFLNKQPVDDLSLIKSFRRLRYFQMSNRAGELKDLSPLANCKNLRRLYLGHYPIEDLSPLRQLKRLRSCTIFAMHELTDISPLASSPNLKELTIRSTKVHSIMALKDHQSLKTLTIKHSPIANSEFIQLQAAMPNLDINQK